MAFKIKNKNLWGVTFAVIFTISFTFNNDGGDLLSIGKKTNIDNSVQNVNVKIENSVHKILVDDLTSEEIKLNDDELKYLISSKSERVEVEENSSSLSKTVKHIIDEFYAGNIKPLKTFNIDKHENSLTIDDSSIIYYFKAQIETNKVNIENYLKRSIGIKKTFNNMYYYARFLYNNGRMNDSYPIYLEAIEQTTNHLNLAIAYNELGLVAEPVLGQEKSIKFLEEALDYKKLLVIEDNSISNQYILANTLNNLGNVYTRTGKFAYALDNFEKALEIFQKYNFKYHEMVTRNGIGNVYSEMIISTENSDIKQNYLNAYNEYQKSLILANELKDNTFLIQNNIDLSKLANNILSFPIGQQNIVKIDKVKEFLNLASEYNLKNKHNQILFNETKSMILSEYARLYYNLREMEKAKQYALRVLNIYKEFLPEQKERFLNSYLVNNYNYVMTRLFTKDLEGLLTDIKNLEPKLYRFFEHNQSFKIQHMKFLCKSLEIVHKLYSNENSLKQDLTNEMNYFKRKYIVKYDCKLKSIEKFRGETIVQTHILNN